MSFLPLSGEAADARAVRMKRVSSALHGSRRASSSSSAVRRRLGSETSRRTALLPVNQGGWRFPVRLFIDQAKFAQRNGPLFMLAVVLLWQLSSLRATLLAVPYLNDSSVHAQMVRFATASFRAGRDPVLSWFPYLGEGSPQFLHYQPLGAMLAGAAGLLIGPDTAFRWSLYLLAALWPLAVYGAARLFGFSRWMGASAAALSPLVASVALVGYEHGAYLWIGYGLWAQLWASWTLLFAWAATWRALAEWKYVPLAALFIAVTIAFHYETGYLALLAPLAFWPLQRKEILARIRRSLAILVFSFLGALWVLVPLVAQGQWASLNQPLAGTTLENGYGARTVLGWLTSGALLDHRHWPLVTLLAAVGLCYALVRWRVAVAVRPVVVAALCSLVLSFGRTTFGSATNIIPGTAGVFFRRFAMGAQLGALIVAGVGAVVLITAAWKLGAWVTTHLVTWGIERRAIPIAFAAVMITLELGGLWSASGTVNAYDRANAREINAQRTTQATALLEIGPLISYIRLHGNGRTYAGTPNDWGSSFTVGMVPVYKFLAAENIDDVGFTLRTASLMTGPETNFTASNLSNDIIFGVRYFLLPNAMAPPLPANLVLNRGQYSLWVLPQVDGISLQQPVGVLVENRANLASAPRAFLESSLVSHEKGLIVQFTGAPQGPATLALPFPPAVASNTSSSQRDASLGRVSSAQLSLEVGRASATVQLRRRAVVVLSASFDPGWSATVDGRHTPTVMMAPAVVGVWVEAGTHTVRFRYDGFSTEHELEIISATTLLLLLGLSIPPLRRAFFRLITRIQLIARVSGLRTEEQP